MMVACKILNQATLCNNRDPLSARGLLKVCVLTDFSLLRHVGFEVNIGNENFCLLQFTFVRDSDRTVVPEITIHINLT